MKRQSLKLRFVVSIAVAYLVIGALTYVVFNFVTGRVVDSLGTSFAIKQALLEKSRLLSALQRDLSLSLKLGDSPLLKRWAVDEHNRDLGKLAREELESYRRSFTGQSLFFIPARSRNYYFSDGPARNPFATPRYVLNPVNVNDSWYFRTMHDVDNFELNVDYDNHLNTTKVWFNVVIKDAANRKIGLGGSGIDITRFIDESVNSAEPGVETIIFSRDGAIEGHRDKNYVIRNSKVRGDGKKITIYDLLSDKADRQQVRNALQALTTGSRDAETFALQMNGRHYLAAMSYLRDINWFNLVLVDATHVVSARDFLPILAITIASLLAVLLIIGFLLNRQVLFPLSRLAETSNEIARGNFGITMPVGANDEIGSLTRSFNDMARMVKDYTDNLEQKVNERTEELQRSSRELAESNRQIMDSIHYAQLIQASILPDQTAIRHSMRDFFAIYRPRDIVGGDFYFFRAFDEKSVIAVIDCTGHGVPGAFMTMTANAVLNHVLDTADSADPAAILKEFNRLLRAALHHDKVATAVDNGLEIGLCWCSPGEGRLVFAGARIDLYAVSDGQLTVCSGDKQPIGYRSSKETFTYRNHTIIADRETTFYLASDGVLDQSGGAKGWGFGRKRLEKTLVTVANADAATRQEALETALAAYQGDYPQRDDLTLVSFKLDQPLSRGGNSTDATDQSV